MKYLGIDFGTRRIGLALSDTGGSMAFPHATLDGRSSRKAIEEVRRTVEEEGVEGVVVGLPLSLDGSRGPSALRCQSFAERLEKALDLPIHLWDERFSTSEAEYALQQAEVRPEKRRDVIDQVAAAVILQSYLDAHDD